MEVDTRLAGPVVEKTANIDLGGHRVIAIVGGLTVYADQTNIGHFGFVRGITPSAYANGTTAKIQVYGPMIEPSWSWVPGKIYAGTNGVMTQTPPTVGWLQIIATVDDSQTIFIDLQEPILLG